MARRPGSRQGTRQPSLADAVAEAQAAPGGGRRRGPAPGTGGAVWLFGMHAVRAALENPQRVPKKLMMTEELALEWKVEGLPLEIAGRKDIERFLPPGATHQGIALLVDPLPPIDLDEAIDTDDPNALIVVLDQVTDPHNVGAILRSAAAFGALAVVAQDRHAAPATGTLAKSASGALERVPLVHVTNLSRALERLKKADFWCVGLDSAGPGPLSAALRPGRVALVLGAEGAGLRRLVGEHCDVLARLPTLPDFPSLNVSNAAAVALYAVRAAGA